MKTCLPFVVVVALVVSYADARSSVYSWAVQCRGTTVDRILLCGYGLPDDVAFRSSGRRPFLVPPTSSAMTGVRTTPHGTEVDCYVNGHITAVGLMGDLSGGYCTGKFTATDNYLTVPSKCSGYFLVTLCQPMI